MYSEPMLEQTIKKTLLTAKLFDRFWDRWFAHGIAEQGIRDMQAGLNDVTQWMEGLHTWAVHYEDAAGKSLEKRLFAEAEHLYRTAGLYDCLTQWIFPASHPDKRLYYQRCKERFQKADSLTDIPVKETVIQVNGQQCFGRVRVPNAAKGCVVIINPIDSSKEELFTYERDFVQSGFATVHFDGPGQGETYITQNFQASQANWTLFIHQVVQFAAGLFPDLPVFLFGTSSGAAWAIYGSSHPKVSKAVAVSPACGTNPYLPDYFVERMGCILEQHAELLPDLGDLSGCKPVMLVHGKQDSMVSDEDMYALFNRLPDGKQLIEYEDEGHCCNFKLAEIRKSAAEWFMEGLNENDI